MLSGTRVSETLWQIDLVVPVDYLSFFESALEKVCEAVLTFMMPDDNQLWHLAALSRSRESPSRMALTVLVTASAIGVVSTPNFTITQVETHDWAEQNLHTFPPLTVGRFYIYGEHIKRPLPHSKIPLLIDATIAFGSGEHQSTQGCLLALERLTRSKRRFQRCIDMGCGTGILSLAAAKLWHAPVCAVDIDATAVRVTSCNARRNGVHKLVLALQRDAGMIAATSVRRAFDLVIANLLASPLAHMARDVARILRPGGRTVLSGLLTSQENQILNIYRSQGLVLEHRIILRPWLTLTLQKKKGHDS